MTIIVKDKHTLLYKGFRFKCCIGKNNFSKRKIEGDKKTPIGTFKIGNLFYRADRFKRPLTKLKTCRINKNMGWCNDVNHKKYNKLINFKKKFGDIILNLKHILLKHISIALEKKLSKIFLIINLF